MSAPVATALPIAVELVENEIPVKPLVLVTAETATLIENLKKESIIVIDSPQAAESAAAILRDATRLHKDIDAMRLSLKRPFMAIESRIDNAAKAPLAALFSTSAILRPKLAAWQTECERRAREAEAARQEQIRLAEAERIRAEQAASAAEQARLAAIEAAKVKPATPEVAEFAEYDIIAADVVSEQAQVDVQKVAQASAALQQTRAVIAPRAPAGISFRKTLKFEVLDVGKLPTHLVVVSPNNEAIRRQFIDGWKDGDPVPTHPGLRFTAETTTVTSTARR